MDQSELRQWESRCTQEEPPRCRAACPLHVDVRAFCTHMAEGDLRKAWGVLCRTLPLPTLLARICDQPCRNACLRNEAGGGLHIAGLERACAEASGRPAPAPPMPRRGLDAVILGGDLAGLAAAWDLSRKGITVALHTLSTAEAILDGLRRPAGHAILDTLSAHLAEEVDTLRRMGVTIHEGPLPPSQAIDEWVASGHAVFIAPVAYPLYCEEDQPPDVMTLGTVTPGVFAAIPPARPGDSEGPDETAPGHSPVEMAALGRRAATSMERFLQKVSLVAGREREGVFSTRLFTSLADVVPLSPVVEPPEGYTADEARREAARCIRCECMECVRHCAYLAEYGGYPKQYARRIYNNESIVMGTRQANTMIDSCMMCGLCATVCPEGFDMGALCLDARRSMVHRDKMPPSAHEFALRDMAFANSGTCVVARHEAEKQNSTWLFFPGCQLTASAPGLVESTWCWLQRWLPAIDDAKRSGVGLLAHCCGAPAHWAGREQLHQDTLHTVESHWEELGRPILVTACPSCATTLRNGLPHIPVETLWEKMAEVADRHGLEPFGTPHPWKGDLVLHDPCGTREDEPLRNAVRALLVALGVEYREPALTRERTECCGFGGLVAEANPPLADKLTRGRAERLSTMGTHAVTYCAMCRDRLVKAGTPTAHMLNLFFSTPDTTLEDCTPPAPGYSQRRENRVALCERLKGRSADAQPAPAWASIPVHYTEKAAALMEERRILDSDVRKVLHHAMQSGRWIDDTGDEGVRIACLRPVVVTYWVTYTIDADGVPLVRNVWCHRMHVIDAGGRQ